MEVARKLVKSSASRVVVMLVGAAVSFFMLPFLVSRLGDRWYGIWTIVGAMTSYYYLVDFGMASAVTRFVTQKLALDDTRGANEIINTSLVIYAVMGVVIVVASAVLSSLAHLFVKDPVAIRIVRLAIFIVGLNLALEFPFKAFAGIIGAYVRYDLLSYSHLSMLFLSTSATIYFLNRGHGMLALATIGLVCSQFSNFVYFLIARHLFKGLVVSREYFSRDNVGKLFGYSIWAFVNQIGDQLRFRVDSFVIGLALSATHVTHFFIGARLVELFVTLAGKATNMLTPVFTRYHTEGKMEEIRAKLLFMTKLNTIVAVFGGGLIIVIGRPFITRWMGDSYLDAYPILVTLVLAAAFEIVNFPTTNVLYAIARHDYLAKITLIEGLANLVLSISLVAKYGTWGVALGTALPLIVTRGVVLPAFVCRTINLSARHHYSEIFATSAFTGGYLVGFFFIVRNRFLVPEYPMIFFSIVLSFLFYLPAVFMFSFNRLERSNLLVAFRLGRLRGVS